MLSFTIVVQGTDSQTIRVWWTFRSRTSLGHCTLQRTHLPGFWYVWQVQGSTQHSPHVFCHTVLHLPGTQYCSTQHSLTLRCTVLQVVTGLHTVLTQVL